MARPEPRPEQTSNPGGAAPVTAEILPIVAAGRGVGQGVVTGRARFVPSKAELGILRPGEILMAHDMDPTWAAQAKGAVALIANADSERGAAALARKLGVPAVVGTMDGAARAWTGATLTVCAEDGGPGVVYERRGPSA